MTPRKRTATLLRRIADRLDPPVPPTPRRQRPPDPSPMEFVTSQELKDEICRRNDVVLLLYGRHRAIPGGIGIESSVWIKAAMPHILAIRATLRDFGDIIGVDLMGGGE